MAKDTTASSRSVAPPLSMEVLTQIYQKAGDAIIIFEPHSEQVLEANDTACAIYGYTPAEFRSLSMKQLTKDVERGEVALQRLLNGEDIGNFETVQYKKSGERNCDALPRLAH